MASIMAQQLSCVKAPVKSYCACGMLEFHNPPSGSAAVAVCFAGQARTLLLSAVRKKLLENLIHPLDADSVRINGGIASTPPHHIYTYTYHYILMLPLVCAVPRAVACMVVPFGAYVHS